MAIDAANRVPDEIVSEILSLLLKHSDEVFCDQSEKPLLDPDHSASRYLLVCKTWLRVSTPLLYNVVILRTTAQAEALQAVLKTNKEFGLFIKKLRVEGGFGNAMHTILNCAPNLTDLYLTLFIAGSDNVKGLCSGLALVNPRRVIVVDAGYEDEAQPRKNKKVTELFEVLVRLIPKWDRLQTFQFPYVAGFDGTTGHATTGPRADGLASALAKSETVETLIVPIGNSFPEYLRKSVDATCLTSIHFTSFKKSRSQLVGGSWGLAQIREVVNQDPQLKAITTFTEPEDEEDQFNLSSVLDSDDEDSDSEDDDDDDDMFGRILAIRERQMQKASRVRSYRGVKFTLDEHENYSHPGKSHAFAETAAALKRLGDTIGGTVKTLSVCLNEQPAKIDPIVLDPFTSVTSLTWRTAEKASFLPPHVGFSVLPLLEELTVQSDTVTLSFLNIMQELPLNSLRVVDLIGDISGAATFLQRHGAKLQELITTPGIVIAADVFNVCTSLHTLKVLGRRWADEADENDTSVLREDFFACSTPHGSLAKIHFLRNTISRSLYVNTARKEVAAAGPIFEQLNPKSFPALKEIQMDDIKWPTSEQEARKNGWVPISEALHGKGIKVVDEAGVSGPTGARGKLSSRRR